MASLNEQMTSLLETEELPYADDASASIARTRGIPKSKAFYPVESIQKLESWNSGMKQEKLDAKIDENIQNAKEIGTGLATGAFGLPSDILEGVNYINDFMAEQGSPKAIIFKDALNEAREKYGRAAFDKKFTEITGIKSDASNMNQIIGEVLSPGALIVGGVKGTVKATQGAIKLYDFLQDAFKTQTNLLRGNIPPGGTAQTVTGTIKNTATSNQMGKLTINEDVLGAAADAAKIRNINNDNPNKPQINLNEIGLNTAAGKKGYTDYIGVETEAMGGTYTPERYRKLSLTEKDRLYKETGVYRGSDGKVRYKISTADAQLEIGTLNKYSIIEGGKNIVPSFNAKNIPSEGLTLKEVLNHADLYKQYPDDIANATKRTEYTKSVQYGLIENIKVKNFDTYIKEKNLNFEEAMAELKNTQAIYSRSEGAETIYLRSGKLSDVRSSILHEVQHAIQHREGFAAGSSPQKFLFDSKTDFGKTYLDNQENIRIAKNEAEYDFIKTTDKNGFRINFIENKDLFESVTDKLVKREFNKFTGNSRFLAKENMLVEDRLKETFRGSGVYDKQPVIYQGYDTRNVLFNNAEMNLANSLADNTSFQDYIRQRITIEQTVKDQKLMEAEAHKMYASEIGEVQARKIQEDDLRYKEIVQQLRDNNKLKPNEEPNAILKERIFRSMNPSEKNVLQGQKNISVDKSA